MNNSVRLEREKICTWTEQGKGERGLWARNVRSPIWVKLLLAFLISRVVCWESGLRGFQSILPPYLGAAQSSSCCSNYSDSFQPFVDSSVKIHTTVVRRQGFGNTKLRTWYSTEDSSLILTVKRNTVSRINIFIVTPVSRVLGNMVLGVVKSHEIFSKLHIVFSYGLYIQQSRLQERWDINDWGI